MKFFLPVTLSLILNFTAVLLPAQTVEQTAAINLLTEKSNRGDYAIIEVRLNNEDEFKTLEGSSSGLSRIAIFYGKTANDNPILVDNILYFRVFGIYFRIER